MPKVTSSPKPYRQFTAVTVFLRVPRGDWAAVRNGIKTEFRATGRAMTLLHNAQTPCPVVAYTIDARGSHHERLMVLEETWREPVGAISPESLAREGFEELALFRRYWMARHGGKRFRPMQMVQVYRVRPWRDGDLRELGARFVQRLYRDHLAPHEQIDELELDDG